MGLTMHVLMTADAIGGVWQYALDLGGALCARGADVTLAVMGPAPTPAQQADAAARNLAVRHCEGRLEWMEDAWDDVAKAGEWLVDLERRCAPDVVHLNGYCHACLPWMASVIVVAHSCVASWWRAVRGGDLPPRWSRYVEEVRRGLSAARIVIAPSHSMLAALRREYCFTAPCRVVPNGRTLPAERSPSPKVPIVFSAGRLWDEAKDIVALSEIAPALDWPVHVAGDARAPDGRVAAMTGVAYLGHLDSAGMQACFDRAAIYALPARYEPFGLSVLEAAAAGCALVLGDIESLRENWSGAALFVPPGDRKALTAAIQSLITDSDARARLSMRAAERARRFSVDRMVKGYLLAYEDAFPRAA